MYSMATKMKMDRKPPLPRSPTRHHRRVLPSSNSVQNPPGSLTKYQQSKGSEDIEESALRSEYRTISCELRNLAKMVREELGSEDSDNIISDSVNSGMVFERGRFYNEYSARRNERLKKRKKDESKSVHGLGVTMESAKKSSSRKIESLRKSITAALSVEPSETPRYMLRSMTKDSKKPPLAANFGKKTGAPRAPRI